MLIRVEVQWKYLCLFLRNSDRRLWNLFLRQQLVIHFSEGLELGNSTEANNVTH